MRMWLRNAGYHIQKEVEHSAEGRGLEILVFLKGR